MSVLRLSPALFLAGLLGTSFVFAQGTAPEAPKAPPKGNEGKIVVSGGTNMGTYIEAVQANFGKSNVTVALPTIDAGKK